MKKFLCFFLIFILLGVWASALADFNTGYIVTFGQFDQDNNNKNGKEDIEWIVVENNGEEMILLSRYVLTARPFSNNKGKIDWSKSTIRTWLNETFLNNAFTAKEQKAIVRSTHNNSASESEAQKIDGKETTDRVYLLSYAELVRYFPEVETRRAVYTDAAIKAYSDGSMTLDELKKYMQEYKDGCEYWLLRTVCDGFMGMDGYYPEVVMENGEMSIMGGSPVIKIGIRPAVIVNLQKAEGLIDILSNKKITLHKQKLCETFYIKKVKSGYTPQRLMDEGHADIMTATMFLDALRAAKKDPNVSTVIENVPIHDMFVKQHVYAGVTEKGSGFAAYPETDGNYCCLVWQDKDIMTLGSLSEEDLTEALTLMKQTAESEWVEFWAAYLALSDNLGVK